MSNTSPAPDGAAPPHPVPPYIARRRDGWTIERQLIFLNAFADKRSVTRAAALAGKSVASVYRLCGHPGGYKFAAAVRAIAKIHLRALAPTPSPFEPTVTPLFRMGKPAGTLTRLNNARLQARLNALDRTAPPAVLPGLLKNSARNAATSSPSPQRKPGKPRKPRPD